MTDKLIGNLFYEFTIDGTSYIDYLLDYDMEEDLLNQSGNTCRFFLSNAITSALNLIGGMTISIQRGVSSSTEFGIFTGLIYEIDEIEGENKITLLCHDRVHPYQKQNFTKSYDINVSDEAGEWSAIFKDIVDNGPYTATVDSSGTGAGNLTVKKFRNKRRQRLERMRLISNILDWTFFDDYDKEDNEAPITLKPKGYTAFSTSLIVGTNVINRPVFQDDMELMRNKVIVEGAFEEGEVPTETFNGDNSTTVFTLQYIPATTTVTLSSVIQIRGAQDQTTAFDYYVDDEFKQIIFSTAPPTGTGNVVVSYTTPVDRPVEAQDDSSIGTYGITQEEIYKFPDITGVDDAEQRAVQLLQAVSTVPTKAVLHTTSRTIRAGFTVDYQNPFTSGRDGNYLVTKVKRNLTDGYDRVSIGSGDFDVKNMLETIQSRIDVVEEVGLSDTGLIRQVINPVQSLLNILKTRWIEIYKRSVSADNTLFWSPDGVSNGPNMQWDNFQWAADSHVPTPSNMTLVTRVPPLTDGYWEEIYDTKFYDSVNSTGVTWTIDGDPLVANITITDTNILYTEAIQIGPTPTSATLTLGTLTGTLTAEISADGKSTWQSISEGVQTVFTSADGTGVYIRLTATSAVTIENSLNTNGTISHPAIKVLIT